MRNTILVGDCRERLREVPAGSVQCVVTSPPYWGLRDYGVGGQLGLEPVHDCLGWARGERCGECYVCHLREVFVEVWRVLRDDGTVWLNLGDGWAGSGKGQMGNGEHSPSEKWKQGSHPGTLTGGLPTGVVPGLKPKDLCMVPARVALALQADGWYLRAENVWAKPNPMPESVTDRTTRAHEMVYLLSKRGRYYYDAEAVKEQGTSGPSDLRKMEEQRDRLGGITKEQTDPLLKASARTHIGQKRGVGNPHRNLRSVWTIGTRGFPGAHFATYPEDLVRPCIRAGTSERGCCPECGKAWVRVVERTDAPDLSAKGSRFDRGKTGERDGGDRTQPGDRTLRRAKGFRPACTCDAGDPVPCLVLDPFLGSGTTALVAVEEGRDWLGCELSEEYAEMARRRIAGARRVLPMEREGTEEVGEAQGVLFG